jgi:hypothetical protein
LQRAGFGVEAVRSSAVPVGLAVPRFAGWLVNALERFSVTSARFWKRMFAYQFIVTARAENSAEVHWRR